MHTITSHETEVIEKVFSLYMPMASADERRLFEPVYFAIQTKIYGDEMETRGNVVNRKLADEALEYIEKHPKVSYADALTMLERQRAGVR